MYQGLDFPNISPILFKLGFLEVRWYALAYILGILLAWGLARKMVIKSRSTITVLKIDDFISWAIFGIVIGGRLGYILFYNLDYYLEFPFEIFCIWKGGMSFHGGLLGVAIATICFAVKNQISILKLGDILCCVAPIGLFLGRIANFVNAELVGRISYSVPWAIVFPYDSVPRHPSQIYEALGEGLFLFLVLNILWWKSDKYRNRDGFFMGLFFVLYGGVRLLLERFREPDAHLGFLYDFFTMGQLLCLPMIVMGCIFLRISSPKYKLRKIIRKG